MDILILPREINNLITVNLPDPKNQELQVYYHDEENLKLYESVKFKDQFRSWFIENSLCSDGHFHMITRVDPLFILMPQIRRFANEMFRTLDDICATYTERQHAKSSKIQYALAPDIKWDLICDLKELDDDLYIKFNESKTLDWLTSKHEKLMESLHVALSVDRDPSTATLMSYAFDLINVYVPSDLSEKFRCRAISSKK